MASCEKRRVSFCLPEELIQEVMGEANRHDRSPSWIAVDALKIGLAELKKRPGVNDEAFKNLGLPLHLAGHSG